jgi:hypothetical protein
VNESRRFEMGLFKPKIVKEITGGAWGHMVSEHKIDVDTLSREFRCVEKKGTIGNGVPVTFLRVFKPAEVSQKSLNVSGWEFFDQHPELIFFEGYLRWDNQAFLERKRT